MGELLLMIVLTIMVWWAHWRIGQIENDIREVVEGVASEIESKLEGRDD